MVKNAKYHVSVDGSWEVVHHETSDKMVKFFDESGNEIGTLQDLSNGGKILQNIDPTTVKYSGVYRIKTPTGTPSEFADGKIAILGVQAVGKVGTPDFIHYTLVHQKGAIYNNTKVGTTKSGWSAGGKSLATTINDMKNILGEMSLLSTKAKNVAQAINEVYDYSKSNRTQLDLLKKDYKAHNHDSSYVKVSGGSMSGSLSMMAGQGYKFKTAQGVEVNLATYSPENGMKFNDSTVPLNIQSKGALTHNSKKVWTEANHGAGSGLDADKLHGNSIDNVALLNRSNNSFKSDLSVWDGKSVLFKTNGTNSGVFWRDENNNNKAYIRHVGNGALAFYAGGSINHRIEGNGTWSTSKPIVMDSQYNECNVVIKLGSSDKGMGFYRNKSSKYFGFYNWQRNKRLAYFDEADDTFNLDNAPRIQGRRLWLQGSTPSGSHKVGDIWIS